MTITTHDLEASLHRLSERDRSFAQSLLAQFADRGSLSEKQCFWVGELVKRARSAQTPATAPAAPAVRTITFEALVKLFTSGSTRPVLFRTQDGRDIRLALAGERSSTPGSINVTDTSTSFENRVWFGRITREGGWVPSRRTSGAEQQAVEAALAEFNANPAAAAAAYGQETGACCFCGIALTDPRSVSVGYGPICAGNRGLPWGELPQAEKPNKLSCDIPF